MAALWRKRSNNTAKRFASGPPTPARFDPANANEHNNLGVILVQGGDFDAAIEHYRQALQIRPDFPEARDNLRRALAIRSGRNR